MLDIDIADNSIELRCNEILSEVNTFKETVQKRVQSLIECKVAFLKEAENEWAKLKAERQQIQEERKSWEDEKEKIKQI